MVAEAGSYHRTLQKDVIRDVRRMSKDTMVAPKDVNIMK